MTRLAEIKAAAEAALRVDWVLRDPTIEQVEELARNGLWLAEHCEALAIFARRVSLLDPTVGLMDVHEMVADARTALARLEGE